MSKLNPNRRENQFFQTGDSDRERLLDRRPAAFNDHERDWYKQACQEDCPYPEDDERIPLGANSEKSPGWICNRPGGHKGAHEVSWSDTDEGQKRFAVARWPNDAE